MLKNRIQPVVTLREGRSSSNKATGSLKFRSRHEVGVEVTLLDAVPNSSIEVLAHSEVGATTQHVLSSLHAEPDAVLMPEQTLQMGCPCSRSNFFTEEAAVGGRQRNQPTNILVRVVVEGEAVSSSVSHSVSQSVSQVGFGFRFRMPPLGTIALTQAFCEPSEFRFGSMAPAGVILTLPACGAITSSFPIRIWYRGTGGYIV